MDEKRIIADAAEGDQEAFRQLVEVYQDRVFGHVLSMVSRRDVAEDLTQEIFVKAFFALPRFKRDSAFFTWIYRIASNHCLDFLRKKRGIEQPLDAPLGDEESFSLADTLAAPVRERPEAGVENEAALASLLDELDPEQKLILVLRELEGYSYEELTEMMECPLNTVKSRLNRAREALKALYVQKYGPLDGNKGPVEPVLNLGDRT